MMERELGNLFSCQAGPYWYKLRGGAMGGDAGDVILGCLASLTLFLIFTCKLLE